MTIDTDAREFGLHIRQGGWRLGLLVARNVEPGKGQAERGSRLNERKDEKVSAIRFAEAADTSTPRVMRYLRAWNAAADAGHVPHSDTLTPGQEVDLDVETLPDWRDFYPPNGGKPGVPTTVTKWSSQQRQAAAEQLMSDPHVADAIAEKIASSAEHFDRVVRKHHEKAPIPTHQPQPKERDYSHLVDRAVNDIMVALAAERSGRWDPADLDNALLHFLGRALLDRDMPVGDFDAEIARLEAHANQEAGA